jgi:hypothetical protein
MYSNETRFYTGFEGEPELIFLQKKVDCENKFRLWEGYFDTMMQKVSLSSNSEWTDLAYYYHLCLGCWGEETENWQIPNIESVIEQLQAIQLTGEDRQSNLSLQALILFLKEAHEQSIPVYLTRH